MHQIVKMTQGRTAIPYVRSYVCSYRYCYIITISQVASDHSMEDSQTQDKQLETVVTCNKCNVTFGRILKRKVASYS